MTPAEKIAQDIWHRLEHAQELNVRLGEETLTDLLILDLKDHESTYKIRVLQTTKHQESKFGTDLEINVKFGRFSAYRYAIQAKKLYYPNGSGSGAYRKLNHIVRSGSSQLDTLERYARNVQAMPYYAFYNHRVDPKHYWHCCRNYDRAQFGCTLVPSWVVREAIRFGHKDFYSLHSYSKPLPWRCLFDCLEWERCIRGNWTPASRLLNLPVRIEEMERYDWVNTEPIENAWPTEFSEAGGLRGLTDEDDKDETQAIQIAERYLQDREPNYWPRRLLFVDKRDEERALN